MNKIRLILVFIICSILESTVFSRISIFGINPSLVIPIIVGISMGFGSYAGGFGGIFLGLVQDVMFSPFLGIRALILFSMGFLVGNYDYKLNLRDYRTGIVITCILSLINSFVLSTIAGIQGNSGYLITYLKGPILLDLLFSSGLYYILMKIFNKIFVFPNVRYY